ncbi:hypothetical protein FB645_000169 [Coemansia sp. IMI 203386]|nr:hypothetical protein FB645_000169 [Coemansia sp. IMI 203386]
MSCSPITSTPELPKLFERDVCTIPEPNYVSMNILFSHKNCNIEDLLGADTPAGRYNRRRVISNATVYSGMENVADDASSIHDSAYSECGSENNDSETKSMLTISGHSKNSGIHKRRRNRSRSSSIRSLKSMVSGLFSTKTKSVGA